jgi:hypothetical protein
MTINIALKTSDVLVLGCDSTASATGYYLDPFSLGYETDDKGEPVLDPTGKMTLKFKFDELEPLVTNSWVGVTKMFPIHSIPAPMVAVTSGIAKLNERSIANYAAEFFEGHKNPVGTPSAREICDEFLKFFREKYEEHYRDSTLPEGLRDGPHFLVGGYGSADYLPSLYRLNIPKNEIHEHFGGPVGGLAWAGQSDAVERFIRGYDGRLKSELESHIKTQLEAFAEQVKQQVAGGINGLLDKLERTAPSDWRLDLPDPVIQELDWDGYRLALDYSNLPIQEAVNFVAFLVNMQAGKGRFVRGISTVGGRTHIGVVKKDGFAKINEPELTHRYTGFGDDS